MMRFASSAHLTSYAGRRATDMLGTVRESQTVAQGIDFYIRKFGGPRNRWGDYSGSSVDPVDDETFWVFNQYALERGTILPDYPDEDGRWGTRFSTCEFDDHSFDYKADNSEWISPPLPSGPLDLWFDRGCALYGVHDGGVNNSRLFCINQNWAGWVTDVLPRFDIEGLNYHVPFLFASAGDNARKPGAIFQLVPPPSPDTLSQCVFSEGILLGQVTATNINATVPASPHVLPNASMSLKEVDGITFDNGGNLWGWAQDGGLFNATLGLNNATLYWWPGEVEDVEWLGNKLYGAINLNHETQQQNDDPIAGDPDQYEDVNAAANTSGVATVHLVEYNPLLNSLDFPCQEAIETELQQLATTGFSKVEIEALEVLDGQNLLLGFHATPPLGMGPSNALILGVLNLGNCSIGGQVIYDIPRENNELDVEGLAMVCPE